MGNPRILAVGTAVPTTRFDQSDLLAVAGYDDPQRRGFFLRSGIEGRHLYMDAARPRADESVDELTARFQEGSVTLGAQAVRACLERADTDVGDVDFIGRTGVFVGGLAGHAASLDAWSCCQTASGAFPHLGANFQLAVGVNRQAGNLPPRSR